MLNRRAYHCNYLFGCFCTFPCGLLSPIDCSLCALCCLSCLFLFAGGIGSRAELFLISIDTAYPSGRFLDPLLAHSDIAALLLSSSSFLRLLGVCLRIGAGVFTGCGFLLARFRGIPIHGIILRRFIRLIFASETIFGNGTCFPQCKESSIFQMVLCLLDSVFFHFLCGSVVAAGPCARCRNCFFLAFQPCFSCKGFRQPVYNMLFWHSARRFLLGFFVGILFHCITCFLKILYKGRPPAFPAGSRPSSISKDYIGHRPYSLWQSIHLGKHL